MENISTLIYAVLMIIAYAAQVHHIHRTKSTHGLSFIFFFLAAVAVALRMITTGFIIRDTNSSLAWFLEIAEFTVLGGLVTICLQIIYYRHYKK